jgi:hypothetical protein
MFYPTNLQLMITILPLPYVNNRKWGKKSQSTHYTVKREIINEDT